MISPLATVSSASGLAQAVGSRPAPWRLIPADHTFSSFIATNQLWNRMFIESFGYYPWVILWARNLFERLEKGLDWLCWLVMGFALPLVVGANFNRWYGKRLLKTFGLAQSPAKDVSPLNIPLELLDEQRMGETIARFNQQLAGKAGVAAESETQRLLRISGLQRFEDLADRTIRVKRSTVGRFWERFRGRPAVTETVVKLADGIRRGKILILLADLLLMASKGQIYFWLKNWMTEHFSGRKGFSGKFKYTSESYLAKDAAGYEKSKMSRLLKSLTIGYGAALTLPLLVLGILKHRSVPEARRAAGSVLNRLKNLVHHLNYVDVIFMSKWVLAWHVFFNYNVPGLLSARDGDEFRETLSKSAALDFCYFIGDELIAGLAAWLLSRRPKYRDTLSQTPIVEWKSFLKGRIKIPLAVHLKKLSDAYGNTSPAYRLGRAVFWTGLGGTSAFLATATPLINNWYTEKRTRTRQRAQKIREALEPLRRQGRPLQRKSFEAFVTRQQQASRVRPAATQRTGWPAGSPAVAGYAVPTG